jgi:hypothetical protein
MRKNPSPANMKKVAQRHKHSPGTSGNYYRMKVTE